MNPGVQRCRSREEFLQFRKAFIGASEVAAVFGESPFAGPYDVWARKVGEDAGASSETIRMRAGKALEAFVLELYRERTGYAEVEHNEYEVYYDPEHYLCATPDAFVTTPEGPGLVECKTVNSLYRHQWGEDGTGEVPTYYYLQAVTQIGIVEMVTGFKLASYHFAVLFDLNEFCIFPIDCEAARKLYPDLAEAVKEWFYEHIVANVPPDPHPADTSFRKILMATGQTGDEILEATEEINKAAENYLRYKGMIDAITTDLEAEEMKIKAFIGEKAGVRTRLGTFTWKQTKDRAIVDYQGIVEHLKVPQDIIAQFTKVAPGVRRFLPPRRKNEN